MIAYVICGTIAFLLLLAFVVCAICVGQRADEQSDALMHNLGIGEG